MLLAFFALVGIPIARILRRAGFSPWWVVPSFIPLANIIGLWVFASAPWKSQVDAFES